MAALVLALVQVLPAVTVNAQGPPTVNGRFYGDGDDSRYIFLMSESSGRGDVYYYLDGSTLYLAVVVDTSVNDNVFGVKSCQPPSTSPDAGYLGSAGWCPGPAHNANDLIASDHLEIALTCGTSSWSWSQDYAYDADGDLVATEADWLSDPYCSGPGCDAAGTPPPGLISSASSLQWNMNNAALNPGTAWDVTLQGNRGYTGWKSPDDVEWPPSDNDVTNNGYPTYDGTHQWEWPMVYEMSIDVSSCSPNAITVQIVSAHNSPPKNGEEDIQIGPAMIEWPEAEGVPAFPSLYLGIAAAFGAGIFAYLIRKRLVDQE